MSFFISSSNIYLKSLALRRGAQVFPEAVIITGAEPEFSAQSAATKLAKLNLSATIITKSPRFCQLAANKTVARP